MRPLRNFKTNQCCYLTPLAKSGYIAVAGGEKNRYLPGKQYRILRKGKAVICAQPHHFYPTIGVRPSESPSEPQ